MAGQGQISPTVEPSKVVETGKSIADTLLNKWSVAI